MNRREALGALGIIAGVVPARAPAATSSVSTLIGNGTPGFSDQQVNNPYGLIMGPDGALLFCDLANQRIRRLNLRTHRTTTVAGTGQRAYAGDGGAARGAQVAGARKSRAGHRKLSQGPRARPAGRPV